MTTPPTTNMMRVVWKYVFRSRYGFDYMTPDATADEQGYRLLAHTAELRGWDVQKTAMFCRAAMAYMGGHDHWSKRMTPRNAHQIFEEITQYAMENEIEPFTKEQLDEMSNANRKDNPAQQALADVTQMLKTKANISMAGKDPAEEDVPE